MKLYDTGLGFQLSMSKSAQHGAAQSMAGLNWSIEHGHVKPSDMTYILDVDNVKHEMTVSAACQVMKDYAQACLEEWRRTGKMPDDDPTVVEVVPS